MPQETAVQQFDEAAKLLNLDQNLIEQIRHPDMIVEKNFTVRMDSGEIRNFTGWRVHHSTVLGPAKGGIRFHPAVSREEVIDLATWMTWKCALLNLPLGGGKGGVRCNPGELSRGELERITRRYVQEFHFMLGPKKDIPAPDVGTDEQIMAWVMDEYSRIKGETSFSVVTGKPLGLGGSQGRKAATGKGVLYATEFILQALHKKLDGAKISVQGFGNVGSHAALFFHEAGAKIVALSDSSGGIADEQGLDIPRLIIYKKERGMALAESGLGRVIGAQDTLVADCDIFVPAAIEGVITKENAHTVKARLVVEGANGPTTPEADEILRSRDIIVVPDILANAGGVVVSFFEWQQNQSMASWTEEFIYAELKNRMQNAARNVLDVAERHSVGLREAAYMIGIKRVAKAVSQRAHDFKSGNGVLYKDI